MLKCLAAIVLGVLVGGCGFTFAGDHATGALLHRVEVAAELGANSNAATPIDLGFVYDAESAAALPTTSEDWFGSRPSMINELCHDVDVVSLEVVPGVVISRVGLPERHRKAVKVVSYVAYAASRSQRSEDLTKRACVRIRLAAEGPRYDACQ